jgi:hypothetical protein
MNEFSFQATTVNALVNPDYVSYRTDGKNKITDPSFNSHDNLYALRLDSKATTDKVQTVTEKFSAQLKCGSVFKELYIQHKTDGFAENYHVRVHYEPQDQRVVDLFDLRPESKQVRPDGSGFVLHLDPKICPIDKKFFDKGEYQTKFIPGMLAIIKMAEEEGMMESEETKKLMDVLKNANLIKC